MKLFKAKNEPKKGKFFDWITNLVKWAEFFVALIRWAIDALRSFPAIPESDVEDAEIVKDEE